MKLALISFVAVFSFVGVISVIPPVVESAIAAERQGVPGRREGGGSR